MSATARPAKHLVPSWIWALICAGAIATSCTQSVRLDREKASHATYKTEVERQKLEASEKAREKEQVLNDAVQEAQAQADALRIERDRANTAANLASQRLQRAIGRTGACEAARTADERKAADQAANLRAELLGRFNEFAGEISRFADDAHQAGLTCQALYEKARQVTR